MDAASSRNGLVAISAFFVLLFVILTVNSYQNVITNTPIQTQKIESLHRERDLKIASLDSGVTIRHPAETVDEIKEFKHAKITREELGQKGWFLLHLISGNYPEFPDEHDQKNMDIFLKLFAQYYPCKECGAHFYEMLEENPVRASSRKEFMYYLCDLHNQVNKRLHKPQFDCDIVEETWSECGCKEKEGEVDADGDDTADVNVDV